MIQFYFLSIVINALAGYIFIAGDEGGVLEFKSGLSLKDETVRLVLGILSVITGLFKILSPVEGNVPVVGDLIPALVGFVCGFILIFEYYRNRMSVNNPEQSEKIDRILVSNKKIIGIVAIAAAALHFLFPRVLLL